MIRGPHDLVRPKHFAIKAFGMQAQLECLDQLGGAWVRNV